MNGDESEPGTFKDRELLLRTPHLVLEGVILAALVTERDGGFHFHSPRISGADRSLPQRDRARGRTRRVRDRMRCCSGGRFPVSVFVSPGGYICGEQSALIEAMSDRRGEPRNMPPKLETQRPR